MEIKDTTYGGVRFEDWWGDMACIKDVIGTGKYTAKLLPEKKYCRKPKYVNEKDENIVMWHYAGERKHWMEDHGEPDT
jgi:hypothetical protein